MTIIIPVYNGAQWLPQAIESALIQRCEVLVVDDGSTDSSLRIAERYPVRIISQVNKGLASARNTGIMNTTDDWLLFLDADDVLLADCVERLQEEIWKIEAHVIAPSFKEFGLGNREVILMPDPKLEDFRTGNRLGYCAAIKRSALLAIGGYSPRMIWGYEDLHLWINLLTKGFKIHTISDILWMYRIKEQSMITEAQKHHQELLNQINKDFPQAQINY